VRLLVARGGGSKLVRMILAGPKSYYDDYVRKQGTGRTLNDPPSLLTDRGAYVNFLEVQLERVSAACLGVNAYDQRFNDMQGLIVSLEQRCAATTRLVGLAQQCTEEVRLETDNKIESLVRDAREDHANVNTVFQAMSARVAAAEQAIANLSAIVGRVEALEHRAAEVDGTLRAQQVAREEERLAANVRLDELETYKRNSNDAIQRLQTEVSKQELDIDENSKRTSSLLMSIEERLTALQTRHKQEISEKIQETTSRISERLQESHSKLSAEQIALMNDLEAQRTESARRSELIEKSLPKAYNDAIMNAAQTACEIYRAEAEAERQAIEEEIDALQEGLHSQAAQLHTLEEEARQQFHQIDRGLGEFTETAHAAQRRAATALQEAMAATVAVQRASHEGMLVSGSLLQHRSAIASGHGLELPPPSVTAPPLTATSPPLPAAGGGGTSFGLPQRSSSPSMHRTASPQQQRAGSPTLASERRSLSPTHLATSAAAALIEATANSISQPRTASPSRREQESNDSYRSRISPFFSRVPAKDRATPLWFPNRNVSSRHAAAMQMAERARRVTSRQQAAEAKAVEPHVDTVHPQPRFTDMPSEVASRAPLRQRLQQQQLLREQQQQQLPTRRPRSTQEIVSSMMQQHIISEGDDLVSIASSDSLAALGGQAVGGGRYGAVPRDNLRGAAARIAARR